MKSDQIAHEYLRAAKEKVSEATIGRWVRKNFKIKNGSVKTVRPEKQKSPAKILLFDLETAPIRAYLWSKWQKGVDDSFIISDWFVFCWSAKWLFEDKMYNACVTSKEALEGDDKRVMRSLWEMLDEADIVIAHNLMGFDRKKANTRFLEHGFKLPKPYQTIDTLLHARKQFKVTSNRLDYLCKFLGVDGKIQTQKGLWNKCMIGDKAALKDMQEYCDQDIYALENLYVKLRPYIQPHPNIGLYLADDVNRCPSCGSDNLQWGGTYRTYVNAFDAFTCNHCGAVGRSRKAQGGRKNLTVSTPI